jgi:2,3-dihydroxybenzoate-AMP ligase
MIPPNLGELLRETARRFPRRTALVFGQKRITYAQLDEMTDRIAEGLERVGMPLC